MLISYCITCMGRRWQLQSTLQEHLTVFAGRKDTEFVLLDYNSPDGLEEWVRDNFAARRAIDSGLLVYLKESQASVFHCSKAKNLAHRFASGEILVNLDADNWATGIDHAIRRAFDLTEATLFHGYNRKRDGTFGRIGIARKWFDSLGGYDEALRPMSYQDEDLLKRAIKSGLPLHTFVCGRRPIRNQTQTKTIMTGSADSWYTMWISNRAASDANIHRGSFVANINGWGGGTISRNFGVAHEYLPIIPSVVPGHQLSGLLTDRLTEMAPIEESTTKPAIVPRAEGHRDGADGLAASRLHTHRRPDERQYNSKPQSVEVPDYW